MDGGWYRKYVAKVTSSDILAFPHMFNFFVKNEGMMPIPSRAVSDVILTVLVKPNYELDVVVMNTNGVKFPSGSCV
jgi:hypothetical protein